MFSMLRNSQIHFTWNVERVKHKAISKLKGCVFRQFLEIQKNVLVMKKIQNVHFLQKY